MILTGPTKPSLTYAEIGFVLGIRKGQVQRIERRALAKLRELLAARGFERIEQLLPAERSASERLPSRGFQVRRTPKE